MDRYLLLGHPVEHSKSPWIHARFAALTGQALHYDRCLVPLDAFAATVQRLRAEGVRGCNVTVPFKFEAFALADAASPRARLAGACNTLAFEAGAIHADNTDGIGLVRDIVHNAGVPLAGQRLLLIGAGGAPAGVLGPLVEARPQCIVLANRTADKARALAERHAALAAQHGVELAVAPLDAIEGRFGVVVNASASSLGGAAVPVAAGVLAPGALAYDMMYGAAAAPFMDWARSHGAVPRDGLGMLLEQAAESFRIWRGVQPPTAGVAAALRADLAG